LLIDTTGIAHPQGPSNLGQCHVNFAEGCHLYIAATAAILKTRTLTNLYNDRSAWLDHAHRDLDRAVAAAYGWPEEISEEDALARLLALNLERAAQMRSK
jgi:hypothetical protein